MGAAEQIANAFRAAENKRRAELSVKVADLFARYIDRPNDPNSRGSIRDRQFFEDFEALLPKDKYGYTPGDFGILQQNPQYRGIRMVLPQSGGSYKESAYYNGYSIPGRVVTQGPVGEPDRNDPHKNQIPIVPPNYPPDLGGLREMVYGELIRRGYPVYGGTGDMGGDFPAGFNPVGFGQR